MAKQVARGAASAPRNKLPGKTEFSGRRRSVTRKSGHHAHPDSTGGEFNTEKVRPYKVKAGEILRVTFSALPYAANERAFVAFGGWFTSDVDLAVEVEGVPEGAYTLALSRLPDWGKVGAMWPSQAKALCVTLEITAQQDGHIALRGMECGLVEHEFLENAKPALLRRPHSA